MIAFLKCFGGLALAALLVTEVFRIKEVYDVRHKYRIAVGCAARIMMMLMYLFWLIGLPMVLTQITGAVGCILFVVEALAYVLQPETDKMAYKGKHVKETQEEHDVHRIV